MRLDCDSQTGVYSRQCSAESIAMKTVWSAISRRGSKAGSPNLGVSPRARRNPSRRGDAAGELPEQHVHIEGSGATHVHMPNSEELERDDSAGGLLRSLADMLWRRKVLSRDSYRFTSFPRD